MSDYQLQGVVRLKDETSAGANSAKQNVSGLEKAITGAAMAMAAFASVETVKAVFELGKLGAQAQRTERSFENISGGAQAASENLRAMQQATRGALSDTAAMEQANRLLQMGLVDGAESLGQFTNMATTLGTAMGRTTNEAIEEFALLMANQSIPRLDTFGISAGKVRARMEELATANADLTKEQRFNIAVMEEGEKAMARLGDAVEDNALQVERASAGWENFKVSTGKQFTPLVGNLSGAFAGLTNQLVENQARQQEQVEAVRRVREEYGQLEAMFQIFLHTSGVKNTLLTQELELMEAQAARASASAASTERLTAQAEAYTQALAAEQAEVLAAAVAGQDSLGVWEQYNQALLAQEQQVNATAFEVGELARQQQAAYEAGQQAAIVFYDVAAGLQEMTTAQLAREQLDLLKASMEEGALGSEAYLAAQRAVLTQFGILTEEEIKAQSALDGLRQQYVDGSLSAQQFAESVEGIKTSLDAQQALRELQGQLEDGEISAEDYKQATDELGASLDAQATSGQEAGEAASTFHQGIIDGEAGLADYTTALGDTSTAQMTQTETLEEADRVTDAYTRKVEMLSYQMDTTAGSLEFVRSSVLAADSAMRTAGGGADTLAEDLGALNDVDVTLDVDALQVSNAITETESLVSSLDRLIARAEEAIAAANAADAAAPGDDGSDPDDPDDPYRPNSVDIPALPDSGDADSLTPLSTLSGNMGAGSTLPSVNRTATFSMGGVVVQNMAQVQQLVEQARRLQLQGLQI